MATIRLGQLLVDARMLSQQALDEVLAFQKTDGRRLGTLLVERGLVNETQLTQILSHQLSVPWVALLHIEFSRQLLNLVPYEVAERYCMVPIYVRHVRGQGDTLYVAMDDPTNEEPLRECMKYSGLPVRAMIAPPSDIREAIRVCYGIEIDPPHSKAALAKAAASRMSGRPLSQPQPLVEPTSPPAKAEAIPPSSSAGGPKSRSRADGGRDERTTLPSVSEDMLDGDAPLTPRVTILSPANEESRRASTPRPAARTSTSGPPSSRRTAAARRTPSKPPPLPPSSKRASIPPSLPREPPPAPSPAPAGRRVEPDSDGPTVEAVEIEIPRLRRNNADGGGPAESAAENGPASSTRRPPRSSKMVSLTLLDGTTLSLPARPSKPPSAPPSELPAPAEDSVSELGREALTARDLIAALRAVARGADATETLGNNARWEAMFAALLSLLLKKRLITEWELIEELKKI